MMPKERNKQPGNNKTAIIGEKVQREAAAGTSVHSQMPDAAKQKANRVTNTVPRTNPPINQTPSKTLGNQQSTQTKKLSNSIADKQGAISKRPEGVHTKVRQTHSNEAEHSHTEPTRDANMLSDDEQSSQDTEEEEFILPREQRKKSNKKRCQESDSDSNDTEAKRFASDATKSEESPPFPNMKIHTILFRLPHHVPAMVFARRLKEHYGNRIQHKPLQLGKNRGEVFLRPIDTQTFSTLTEGHVRGTILGDTQFNVIFTKTDRKNNYNQRMEKHLNTIVLQGIHEPTQDIRDAMLDQGVPFTAAKAILNQNGMPAGRTWFQLENRSQAQELISKGYLTMWGFQIKVYPYELGPRPRRCSNCQMFENHKPGECQNKTKCSKCTMDHHAKDCPERGNKHLPLKCANCGESHKTNANFCQKYLEKKETLTLSYAEAAKSRQKRQAQAQAHNKATNQPNSNQGRGDTYPTSPKPQLPSQETQANGCHPTTHERQLNQTPHAGTPTNTHKENQLPPHNGNMQLMIQEAVEAEVKACLEAFRKEFQAQLQEQEKKTEQLANSLETHMSTISKNIAESMKKMVPTISNPLRQEIKDLTNTVSNLYETLGSQMSNVTKEMRALSSQLNRK